MKEEMLREFTAAPEVNIEEGIITKIESACNVRRSRGRLLLVYVRQFKKNLSRLLLTPAASIDAPQEWCHKAREMLREGSSRLTDLKEMIVKGTPFKWGWKAMAEAPKLLVLFPSPP